MDNLQCTIYNVQLRIKNGQFTMNLEKILGA